MQSEWKFAQSQSHQHLALIHQFSVTSKQGVEFRIDIKEFVSPPDPAMAFLAQADKQTNQKTAPFLPSGWGKTLLEALAECVKACERFPYEP